MACVIFPRVVYLDVRQGFRQPHITLLWRTGLLPAAMCLRSANRAEPILQLACAVFGIKVAMVALVDGERVFIRNCFGDASMARARAPWA